MEPGDADIAATALRETHEEVGIDPSSVSVLGHLEPMPTVTGYAVTIFESYPFSIESEADKVKEFTSVPPQESFLVKTKVRVAKNAFLIAKGPCSKEKGCLGELLLADADEKRGLVIRPE